MNESTQLRPFYIRYNSQLACRWWKLRSPSNRPLQIAGDTACNRGGAMLGLTSPQPQRVLFESNLEEKE